MRKLTGVYGIAALLAVAGILSPAAALALGLGQIQCNTRIGQPLSARIPILAADRNSLQGLTVSLAKPDAYRQAGLGEPDFLFGLKFQVQQDDSGPYVLITSEQPVRLPFLNLLVHASWPSGEVTRKYTVLLNPPVFAAETSAAPVSVPAAPAARQPVRQAPIRPQPAIPAAPAPQTYGPVRHGETLWHIASGLAVRDGVGVNRMMIAIYRANPGAFFGNINRLEAGAVLKVPSRRRIEAMIGGGEAAREVAIQNRAWRAARAQPGLASPPRPSVAASASMTGQQTGEVVLTAPAVTGAKANAAAPGVATATGAAGVGAGSVAASSGKNAGNVGTTKPASAGGPVKLHSQEMAKLAATPPVKKKKPPASSAANAFNSVNTANTGTEKPTKSVLQNWITTPKGWIVIAAILILLALLLLLLLRRARGGRRGAEPDEAGPPTQPRDQTAIEGAAPDTHASSAAFDYGRAEIDAVLAESDAQEEDVAGLDIASYAGEMQPPLAEEEPPAGEAPPGFEPAEADEMADVLAAADFYAGHGDHGGAADVLRTALADNPGRQDVRRRLLEELFAAGYAQGFRDEAARFHESAPAESDWRGVAAMGRELLPGDELFADPDAPPPPETPETELSETLEITELEFELDKFSGVETDTLQGDFERTLGELSTMIETYVPGGEDGPLELHLPPGEGGATGPIAENEEPPLELKPEEGVAAQEETQEPEPPPVSEAETETGVSPAAPEEAAEDTTARDDISGTRLDLARAYLDMGDQESARDVLEEVLDEGNEAQREEARRLLESLT